MSDPYVRPDVRQFLAFLGTLPGPKIHELEAPAARAQYLMMKDVADPPIGELGEIRDLTIPGPAGDMRARLFDAKAKREPEPVLVFYHGGGWVIGDLDTHASLCAEMARMLDVPVVSVDYRLAPEHPWPAAPDDAEAAARWIAGNPAELGRTATSLVLSGDSAGGNLTIITALALRDDPAAVPVIAQFPIYPAADMSKTYPSYDQFSDGYVLTHDAMLYFNAAYRPDVEHHRGSPLLADMHAMPPAVVLTASLDPIRDQGRAYAGALAAAGVAVVFREAVGNIHGFANMRQAIPSGAGDIAGALIALKAMVIEAEANRVMAQAAG